MMTFLSRMTEIIHMLLPKRNFKRLKTYLKKAFKGCFCFTCGGNPDTVVPAHIRYGEGAGASNKPDDDLCIPLCHDCHANQHHMGEVNFWLSHGFTINEIKTVARKRYTAWKENT